MAVPEFKELKRAGARVPALGSGVSARARSPDTLVNAWERARIPSGCHGLPRRIRPPVCDTWALASIGHVAVGMAAARCFTRRDPSTRWLAPMVAFSALSLLPDVDVVAFAMKIPYGAPLGHRGAAHSLAAAALVAVVVGVLAYAMRASGRASLGLALRFAAYVAFVVASHGVLDAMTDGGKGVALFWPVTTRRFFFPWRPIPVAPIGSAFLSMQGLRVAAIELAQFAPLFVYALFPRSRRGARRGAPEALQRN